MKVIIAGPRDVHGAESFNLVRRAIIDSNWFLEITEIVHGGATGIDTAAGVVAASLTTPWPVRVFNADWSKHGRAAGPIRNAEMARYADRLIAVWDGESRGTKNMINTAKKYNLQTYVHMFERY